ncbi:MAG: TIGR02680 family protein [Pseudomonadales bacterium]|nr:TIGR02680 family protein [Pseudomonadales bacterium]MBP9033091.1 TIGR02680 family protein [Pseudomonadales bacterium]
MDTPDTLIDLPAALAAAGAHPALPLPTLTRWQPLRLGLVELFHYDSEEFWFRDGHLLLRGNNGTGKSKVLSLTLPFLFDAQLKSSRLEPDGDAGKKMAWNLLLGKFERRIGYAWIEFGRIAEDGQPEYLSLGCGLSAAAARAQVDAWFFVLEARRLGQDLWLTSPARHVLTRERLKEALQHHGQVFDTATAYRRAVDERLFHLGAARYAALMDTLVQLRQPQLSRKPDEGNLSDALTEALPPMSADLLTDVADALSQLEEYRRELLDYELLAKAVGQFNQRYQRYAATNARRQSRALRSAQTGYDNASRTLNEARTALHTAQEAENEARGRSEAAEAALQAGRTRLEQLQSDPAMKDANRLAQAERDVQARTVDHAGATRLADEAAARFEREGRALEERSTRRTQAEGFLSAAREEAAAAARASGIGEPWQLNALAALPAVAVATLDPLPFDAARNDLRHAAARRREQLALVQRRVGDVTQAEAAHAHRQRARDERLDEAEAAATRRSKADATVEAEGNRLVEAWQEHFASLAELQVDEPPLTALTLWVGSLHGDNPARAILVQAQQRAADTLAQLRASQLAVQQTLVDEQLMLDTERERLLQGEDAAPPVPPTRAADARAQRAGAPLWQLVDFRAHVGATERAGLEAALEAAGLLDAWVSPDGRLQPAGGAPLHDTQWLERPCPGASLAAWLAPADGAAPAVDAALLGRLLEGIACTAHDDGQAEAWIAPDGRFRLGALAGAWHKPQAAYIGYAARAAARTRRLAAIASRLQEIAEALRAIELELHALTQRQVRASAEWQGAPSDETLRTAHADAAAREREFQAARSRLEEAERELRTATDAVHTCRDALAADAADLHLPTTAAALESVGIALMHFGDALHALVQAAHALQLAARELAQQQARCQEAEADARQFAAQVADRRLQLDEAQVRLDTLRESIGAQVDELHQRLREARDAVTGSESRSKAAGEAWRAAGEARARGEQKMQDADVTLQERTDTRQRAIAQLQGFAATGLLSAALPDAELPDPATAWTIEPALTLARRTEQALAHVADDDEAWTRIQSQISHDYSELGRALGALGQQAQADASDYGLVVSVVYQNRPQRPDQLTARLDAEIAQRRELLTARERTLLENHLQAEIAAEVQRLLQAAERQVDAINKELHKRPTSTGVRFRLLWQPLPEGAEGAPVGLDAARKRLLNTSTDLWSAEDRRVVGEMLQQRIAAERMRAEASGGSLLEQLARALDYRRWHRFRVQRWQDGEWRPLSGPASSGERALGLTVPLFAAVSSYYSQGGYALAPRLVLLDEAFAGIDDAARAHCMGLIHEFDLDFVITSEREWGCYAELPGVAICQLQRREGVDAVHVSRWTWDGRARRREDDPDRRFPPG